MILHRWRQIYAILGFDRRPQIARGLLEVVAAELGEDLHEMQQSVGDAHRRAAGDLRIAGGLQERDVDNAAVAVVVNGLRVYLIPPTAT